MTQKVLGADGVSRTQTPDQVPVLRDMHGEITQTIRLLVLNGQFVDGRIGAGQKEVFE